jgi:hypothetical protein
MKYMAWMLASALACGCNGNSQSPNNDGGAAQDLSPLSQKFDMALGPAPMGTAITATPDQWTWVDFPDSSCDDGSATGIGVYKSSKSDNVLVFLNGGGACWDYTTCYQLKIAARGPFQKPQFDQFAAGSPTGTVFDRAEPMNPFKDWSFVFIPYCTGDVHAGNNVMMYTQGNVTNTYHHAGHANVLAYLKRLGPTFPTPGKLVVSGSSAGGYGSLLNYPYFRWYWPSAPMFLLDDSGPPLEMGDLPASYLPSWIASWKLDQVLGQTCGDPCLMDFSLGITSLANAWPGDRMALLSSEQDKTISGYFLLSGPGFKTALYTMTTDRIDPLSNFHYFVVTGNTHTMLGNVPNFTSATTPLWTWLNQFIGGDAAWKSTKP